jgi:serine phosphatase RsbU (regulator of sigma subunit)/PAS domain-containing protein
VSADDAVEYRSATGEEAVWRLAVALAGSRTALEVADVSTKEGLAAAGAALTSIAVLEGASRLVSLERPSSPAAPVAARDSCAITEDLPACAAVRGGLPVLLSSLQEIADRYPAISSEVQAAGLSAVASLPLHAASGVALGAVGFGWQEPQSFGAAQLRRLDLIAELTGLALERAIGSPGGSEVADRLRHAVQTMPKAFFSLDNKLCVTFVNSEGERLLRASAHQLVGQNLLSVFPEATGTELEDQYRTAIATGRATTFEGYYEPWESWFEVQAWPDEHGLNVSFSDVSERRRLDAQRAAALSSAEEANSRLSFLTDLAGRLAGVHTRGEVFERLTRAVIPAIADWCTVVVPEGDQLVRVAALHRDLALDGLAKRLVGSYPHRFDGPSPGVVVYRNRQPLRLHHLAQEIIVDLDDSAASAAYGRTLQLLGDGPGLIMPIRSGEEVGAILTMVRSTGLAFSEADVALMDEAAERVSRALDEARQVETQRETASALQAAALPKSLPTFDRVKLAAGYRAASQGSQVGGDWYDAFALQTGRVALVVGDAAGHGVQAAAVMTQLRNGLRAHLFASAGPADSLMGLSRLLEVQEPDAFATIICVDLSPVTGEVTWASAGHPAPILVAADGTSSYLRGGPAPPVGWACATAGAPPIEHHLTLRSGDRLLLFTDGLLERRGVHLDIGLTHLMILAEQTRSIADPAQVCERILQDILGASHGDDVCLMIADFE